MHTAEFNDELGRVCQERAEGASFDELELLVAGRLHTFAGK
jgi:hypothetical protein